MGSEFCPSHLRHISELLLVSIATVLAKGTTQISTNYPSTNYRFWSFQTRHLFQFNSESSNLVCITSPLQYYCHCSQPRKPCASKQTGLRVQAGAGLVSSLRLCPSRSERRLRYLSGSAETHAKHVSHPLGIGEDACWETPSSELHK